jgi:hypothetical protein
VQLGELKYVLVSAILSAFVWFVLIEIEYQVLWGLWNGFLGINGYALVEVIRAIVSVILGAYVGLWVIGRIRKVSPIHGILVGLLFFALYIPLYSIVEWGRWTNFHFYSFPPTMDYVMFFVKRAQTFAGRYTLFSLTASVAAGVFGIIVVRRVSPSFCPYCGNELPPGRDPCPKCRKTG